MQDNPQDQINSYAASRLHLGVSREAVRAELKQAGWQDTQIEAAFENHARSLDPKRVQKGILWIVSPFASLVAIALLQFIVRFIVTASGQTSANPFSLVINIVSILVGVAAVPMMIVGPIVGIVKLTQK